MNLVYRGEWEGEEEGRKGFVHTPVRAQKMRMGEGDEREGLVSLL